MINVVLNLNSVHAEMSFWKIEYARYNKADFSFGLTSNINKKCKNNSSSSLPETSIQQMLENK